MKKVTKLIILVLAAVVSFSGIITMGTEDTYAASVKAPAQVRNFKVRANSATKVKLTWRKIRKNCQGYAIVRNDKIIKRVGKNTSLFYSTAKPGKKYKYQIKAYNTYKIRQYYNSKTKKWQKKKPAKKNWKGRKTRIATAYKYGKASAIRTVTTPKSVKVSKITVSGNNRLKVGRSVKLKTTIAPSNATNKKLTWSSSNASIVKVNDNGVITALKEGNSTITCKTADGGGVKAVYNVSVYRLSKDTTKWIAHRGLHTSEIENTAGAFRAAGEADFWGCECDIYETKKDRQKLPQVKENAEYSTDEEIEQLEVAVAAISDDQKEWLHQTEAIKNAQSIYDELDNTQKSAARALLSDGVLNKLFDASEYDSKGIVINHDETFKRTMGLNKKPGDMTAAEIKEQLPGVCFLEYYLTICDRYNMVPVIEFKNSNMSDIALKKTIDMIYDVDGGEMLRSAHLISFHPETLSRVKEYCEERLKGDSPYTGFLFDSPEGNIEEARNRGFSGINIQFSYLTPDVQKKCDEYGLKIGTWTYGNYIAHDEKMYEHLKSGKYRLLTATVDYLPY